MQSPPLITVKNVKKSFSGASGLVEVLHDVSFEIPESSLTIIYGASGSGKSTLLNLLMGLSAPTDGKVLFRNADVYSFDVKELGNFRANTMGMVQ